MRIYGIEQQSFVDGPGIRMAVFVQGCPHHCEGCHNPGSWDFDGGTEMPVEDIIRTITDLAKRGWIDGLTLSGGEPMCQARDCYLLARAAKEVGLNVWCYTGYTWEQLMTRQGLDHTKNLSEENWHRIKLMGAVDVLVTDPFILAQRTLEGGFRGSTNQRFFDMSKVLGAEYERPLTGEVIEREWTL